MQASRCKIKEPEKPANYQSQKQQKKNNKFYAEKD
jgi:hypothetical protein